MRACACACIIMCACIERDTVEHPRWNMNGMVGEGEIVFVDLFGGVVRLIYKYIVAVVMSMALDKAW